ncbi:MAG TPA: DUF1810 family protein [Trebonia sp.]|nr:DUF1810 family protein [Trebonia sp.]
MDEAAENDRDPYRLERFVAAQDRGGTYERAVAELRAGAKVSHWMWFVFPQVAGLGMSTMAREFAISSVAEARAYLAHPVLGPRLRECARVVAETEGRPAERIFGPVDAMKLRSSMTLFEAADPAAADSDVFRAVLAKYFGGVPDQATLARLLPASTTPRGCSCPCGRRTDGARQAPPRPLLRSLRPRPRHHQLAAAHRAVATHPHHRARDPPLPVCGWAGNSRPNRTRGRAWRGNELPGDVRRHQACRMAWTAPRADRDRVPPVAGERQMLEAWLDFHRQTLLAKCAGLTADQLKERAAPPSGLSLLGLVRHMAEVERGWFRRRVNGEDIDFQFSSEDDPDGEFDHVETADAERDFAAYQAEIEAARLATASHDLNETFYHTQREADMSVRWAYLHMIEEYARHNGHADLLRERIDGATGE